MAIYRECLTTWAEAYRLWLTRTPALNHRTWQNWLAMLDEIDALTLGQED